MLFTSSKLTKSDKMEKIDESAYKSLDKRGSQDPIPSRLSYYLNEAQLSLLHHLEEFGWQLCFVRRPLFQPPTVVILSPEGKQHAVVELDGSLNLEPDLHFRQALKH